MLDIEYIFTWFTKLSRLTPPQARFWLPLCESAARILLTRLREDVDLTAEMDRLCMAAASIAYNTYLTYAGKGFLGDSMRVGDITLSGPQATARAMSQDKDGFLAHIADLLVPEGFAFIQAPKPEPHKSDEYMPPDAGDSA